jgi:hypothetical protein
MYEVDIRMILPERYNIDNIRRVARSPGLVRNEINRLIIKAISFAYNPLFWKNHEQEPFNINTETWDNLFILDACRYDYFKKQYNIIGELQPAISGGSVSWEFMQHNFLNQQFHDTIYITANPHVYRLPNDIFFKIEDLFDKWNDKLGTVHPEDVADRVIEIHNKYPNKRLIIHYMQPHTPWLGETADNIRSRLDMKGINKDPWWKQTKDKKKTTVSGMDWFDGVRKGHISEKEMKEGYTQTLDIVLSSANDLIQQLDGKSVITSDHGEMLGEKLFPLARSLYGHYYFDLCTTELRKVPWLEIDYEKRREVISGSPIRFTEENEQMINSRLEAFGYR